MTRKARTIEFLLSGSPTDAFYSQMAFFRLALDSHGPTYRAARLVAAFGSEQRSVVPDRWRPYFERIEVHLADPEDFARRRYFAASDLRFDLVSPGADVSILCDADTSLIQPLPMDFIDEMERSPALAGVLAHTRFPIEIDSRDLGASGGLYPGMPSGEAWNRLGELILGKPLPLSYRYTLLQDQSCPFYINYGFLAGTPTLLAELYRALPGVQEPVARLLGNDFYGQVGISLVVEKLQLPHRVLPIRFNFPNDRNADRLFPREMEKAVLIHYLRTIAFDRHRIFADPRAFEAFLAADLVGSDSAFQDHVRRVTGSVYPFPGPPGR